MVLPLNEVRTDPLAYESLWVLLRRFMAVNHLRPHELVNKFAPDTASPKPLMASRHGYNAIDLERLAPYIGHTSESVVQTVPDYWEFEVQSLRQAVFKFCPLCLERGYHSVFHEVSWLKRCPIHRHPLRWNCGVCNRHLGHTTIRRLGTLPDHFPCDHPWTSQDIRRPRVYRSADFAKVAHWTRRLKSQCDEEQWYAVALDGRACFYADNEDVKELRDLIGCLGEFSSELRTAIRNPRFRTLPIERERLKDLRPDWFSKSLNYANNFLRLECRDSAEMYDIRDHYQFTTQRVGKMGQEAFLNLVQQKLSVIRLTDRQQISPPPDSPTVQLVASAFLKKHLFSMFWRDYDFDVTPEKFLVSAMRLTAQPLGLLRTVGHDQEIYWVPLRWGEYNIEFFTALRDGYTSLLAKARAEAQRHHAN